jgi:hypothetical protein
VHDKVKHCSARPEYYWMLAFALAEKEDILKFAMERPI